MRIKFILFASLALVAALSLAPGASAKTRTLKVFVTPSQIDVCRPTPDQIRFKFKFKAKITRHNSKLPSKVSLTYGVTDNSTGQVVTHGVATLTARNKFTNETADVTVATGQALLYSFSLKFKAPYSGKTIKSKNRSTDQVPTTEAIDAANAANPAAPPIPNCV